MPDHDPGNAGGSVVIPPSPIRKPRNWFECETCGTKLESQAQLDTHLLTHFGPHPVLAIAGKDAASPLVITDQGALAALEARHACRIEIAGGIVDGGRLRDALSRMNGHNEFDLLLVGRAEHVRRLYRVCVAILHADRVFDIEKDFLAALNRSGLASADLELFARRWHTLPERPYADALAAFRLAILMRDDRAPRAEHAHTQDYTRHLAEARKSLARVSTPLARTINAACCFLVNDFTAPGGPLRDPRLENSLTYFSHIVNRSPLSWVKRRRETVELVVDSATYTLFDIVDRIRAGDRDFVETLRTLLNESISRGDLVTAKKAAAALMYHGIHGSYEEMLVGDPVFAAALARATE
jgi:hypothetical protein